MPYQAGETLTADRLNEMAMGRVRLTRTGPQELANNSTTPIELNNVVYDDASMWDAVDFVIRIPPGYGGLYVMTGSISYASNSTGRRGCDLQSSLGRLSSTLVGAIAGDTRYSTATLDVLQPGDEVWLNGYQQSGSPLNVVGTATNITHLAIARIQPL